MNGASKILTVSYGTFSCTLEGFDDPFNTMKAIAEYFRDLAAEDRYFGAEPPQPDAAMLHKIAEREIQRRVEAKIQENGVILRADSEAEQARQPAPRLERAPEPQASAPAPVAPPATAAAPVAPAPAQEEAAAPRITMPAAEAARPAPAAAPSLAAEGAVTSSVAEKLLRLRQAAAASATSATTAATLTVVPKVAPEGDSYIEDQDAEPAPTLASAAVFDDAEDLLPEDLPASKLAEGEDLLPEDTAETAPEDAPLAASEGAPAEAEATEAEVAEEPATPEIEVVAEAAEIATVAAEEPAALEAEVEVAPEVTPDAVAEAVVEAATEEPAASENLAVASSAAAQDDDSLIASLGELLDPEADDVLLEDTAAPTVSAEVTADLDSIKAALASLDIAPAAAPSAPDLMDLEEADDITGTPVTDQAEPAEEPDIAGITEEIVIEVEVSAEDTAAVDVVPVEVAPVEVAIEAEMETMEPAEAEAVAEAEVEAEVQAEAPAPEAQKPGSDMEDVAARIATPVRPVRPVRPQRPGTAELERPTMLPLTETPAAPPAPAAAASAEPITLEKLQRARARVIRIRHSSEDDQADQQAAEASLSAEAEAALEAELAALRAEDNDQDHGAKTESQTRLPPAGDEAVTRLIAEAATQMDVPDARRRLSAIAHLKAAVAATLADRKSSETRIQNAEAERMTAYRDDLAQVVRPVAAPAPAERPAQAERPVQAERPAPLVLVSEQRIDRPRVAQAVTGNGPTLVGRSSMQAATALQARAYDDEDEADLEDDAANLFDGATSFRDFAERLGAQELPDMLEAAAAYIACVEGRDSFTRPQLMQHLASVATDVAREDSLRSFGILLREGRIEKSRRGLFALNEGSHILAEAKKIAG